MRVMVVGQKWFGAAALRLCLEMGLEVVAAAAPAISDRLFEKGAEEGLPLVLIGRQLTELHVPAGTDLILAAHAHCFITRGAREASRHGALGYHPSLLPRHRGRDAVRWAVHMREPVTGGTVYWMDDRADGGPIAAQDWCLVRPEDTAAELWRRELAPMGLRLIEKVLWQVGEGRIIARPQDEDLATWEPAFDQVPLASFK